MGQINQTFRENLKFYRKKAQLTQAALAERVEISVTFLAEMELGRRCPSFPTFERLAQALVIEPYQLLLSPNDEAKRLLKSTLSDVRNVIGHALVEYERKVIRAEDTQT